MTNYNERLDEILNSDYGVLHCCGDYQEEAKQAILRWVADEVIGEDEEIVHYKTMQADNVNQIIRNSQRQKQRNILARHGYKGGENDQL